MFKCTFRFFFPFRQYFHLKGVTRVYSHDMNVVKSSDMSSLMEHLSIIKIKIIPLLTNTSCSAMLNDVIKGKVFLPYSEKLLCGSFNNSQNMTSEKIQDVSLSYDIFSPLYFFSGRNFAPRVFYFLTYSRSIQLYSTM